MGWGEIVVGWGEVVVGWKSCPETLECLWCRCRAGSQTGWEEGVDSPSVISATQTTGNSHVPHPQLPPHEDKEDPEFPTGLSEGRQRTKSSQLLVNFQFPANFRGMAQADLEYPGAY